MIRRSLAAVLWLASSGLAAPQLTIIQDLLYKADGTPFNGTLTISWTSFQAPDNSTIVTQSTTAKVVNGLLRVQLAPTTTSTPPSTYSVTYNSDGRVQFQETWSVPSSTAPLHVRDVRVSASAGASTAADTSGSGGSTTESNVVGLIADLGARPMKGPGYAAGGTAIVDANGLMETATGDPTDCVHVDGSSGPCGATEPSFVDADTLSGIVDGSNTAFGLSAVPDPASSLSVYRNGMMQKAGLDYNLSGSAISFVTGATPQPGDTLLASYRTTGDDSEPPAPFTSTQVLCSGSGSAATNATLAVLGACSIPSGLLSPGDRVELRFDYSHQGSAGGFSLEVHWERPPWSTATPRRLKRSPPAAPMRLS